MSVKVLFWRFDGRAFLRRWALCEVSNRSSEGEERFLRGEEHFLVSSRLFVSLCC